MSNFTFKKVDAVKAKEQVYQLLIDDKGQLDEFEEEVKDQYRQHFAGLLSILEQAASGVKLPFPKFHPFKTSKNIKLKAFECKKGDLRLYIAQMLDGKVIILGGLKNRQDADIRRFNSLLKQLQDT